MARIDEHLIWQWQQPGVQGAVELAGHVLGSPPDRPQQVRPPHVAEEQGVAGQDCRRRRAVRSFEDGQRDRLRRVSGGGDDLHRGPARRVTEVQPFAVGEAAYREVDRRVGRHRHVGAGPRRQLAVAGHEVGVDVGEHNEFDAEVVLGGVRQIILDVAARIDDDGPSAALIGDEVGRLGQTVQIELFQDHVALPAADTRKDSRHDVFLRCDRAGRPGHRTR